MEAEVTDMLTHLATQLNEAGDELRDTQEFFEAVLADAEANPDPDSFRSAFESRGFGLPGEELLRYLDDNRQLEPLSKATQLRVDELIMEFEQVDTDVRAAGSAADAGPGTDDAGATLWQQAVEQFGESWAAWDGTDAGWQQYRDWFYEATNTVSPDMYALAYERLQPLDDLDPGTRIEQVHNLGLNTSGATGSAAAAQSADGDPNAALWQQAVDQFGEAWATWDGTDSGWREYRDWFYQATDSVSPEMYALAYERLQPLDDLDADARVNAASDLGLNTTGTDILESVAELFENEEAVAADFAEELKKAVDEDSDLPDLDEFTEEEIQEALNIALN